MSLMIIVNICFVVFSTKFYKPFMHKMPGPGFCRTCHESRELLKCQLYLHCWHWRLALSFYCRIRYGKMCVVFFYFIAVIIPSVCDLCTHTMQGIFTSTRAIIELPGTSDENWMNRAQCEQCALFPVYTMYLPQQTLSQKRADVTAKESRRHISNVLVDKMSFCRKG